MAKGRYKPTAKEKKLGALQVGWANKSGKFRASSYSKTFEDKITGEVIGQGSAYATLRIGNKYITVTEKMGEFIIEAYKEQVKKAKTKAEMAEVNKFIKQYADERPGKVGVLFENVSKNVGINQMFKERLSGKMPPGMSAKFDKLAQMMDEMSKSKRNSQLFYDDTKRAFTVVANKYEEMKASGGTLDQWSMQELEEALDSLLELAEQYTDKNELHEMEITSVSETGRNTYSTPTIQSKTKKVRKK